MISGAPMDLKGFSCGPVRRKAIDDHAAELHAPRNASGLSRPAISGGR